MNCTQRVSIIKTEKLFVSEKVISRLLLGEYSAFKALAKDAAKEDIIKLLELAENGDPQMIDYVQAVMQVSIVVNEQTITEIKEAGIMPEAVRRVFKEEFQKERAEGRAEILGDLVKDGIISAAEAAKRLNMTEREFLKETGIYLPQ